MLALVIDCFTRQLRGWQLSRSGNARMTTAALAQALIARFSSLSRVRHPLLLRLDNGRSFTSRAYTRLVKSYGLQQQFITPRCPQQNGMVERVIRTLKEPCARRQRLKSLTPRHSRAISDWIYFCNHQTPHQALAMKDPPPPRRML